MPLYMFTETKQPLYTTTPPIEIIIYNHKPITNSHLQPCNHAQLLYIQSYNHHLQTCNYQQLSHILSNGCKSPMLIHGQSYITTEPSFTTMQLSAIVACIAPWLQPTNAYPWSIVYNHKTVIYKHKPSATNACNRRRLS